ncbi:MAG TPA: CheR family methyltransferase [Solirubrobacteraceae bacterium]|nr:CheR family methyltransferase [Solirubrobacteraceae bacterium]
MPADPDDPCVAFLQWALPRLELCWPGFRRVRRQVCRRVARRIAALGLPDHAAYREHLAGHPEEWAVLRALTPVTISRFGRDRAVFGALAEDVLPALGAAARAAGRDRIRAWSAGCASGEEAYTLALLWEESAPGLELDVLATDIHPPVLARARAARYEASSARELPAPLRARGFDAGPDGALVVRPEARRRVTVARHDLRDPPPDGPFDLVLCRNVAFTYFAPAAQRAVLARVASALRPGGALVLGLHEHLPDAAPGFVPWPGARAVHRYVPGHGE